MKDSKKIAWVWEIKEEYLEEYILMHSNPWPEIMQAHRDAGIRNYSIFQSGTKFFYCFECDDVDKAFQYLAKNEVCQKWNAITSKMVKGSFDFNEDSPITKMQEVFYLP